MSVLNSALAVKSLVEHMATDKSLVNISKSVTIIGQAFQQAESFVKVLQVQKMVNVYQAFSAGKNTLSILH